MKFDLTIDYPVEKLERNRQRMEARAQYRYTDRVPITYCLVPRYFTPLFNIPYKAIFENPLEHYRWQLQFAKYRMEHIPEDCWGGTTVGVSPYFDNTLDSAAFGAELVWPENETLHCMPVISSVEQMERHPMPAPGTGMWGKAIDWYQQMREFAKDTRLSFRGVEGNVSVGLGLSSLSPHMIAIDLVGNDFYWWQVEYPKACHAFLTRITDALIAAQRHVLMVTGTNLQPGCTLGLAEDTAQIMSPDMFREFCVPYARRFFDAFGATGRGIHMCGQSTHLHEALLKDMGMTSFILFGYLVDPKVAARNLGGRVQLWGNINPMLMKEGTPAQVKQAALECIEAIGPCGGFLLGDGANVCPGTPLESFQAIMAAAEEYGLGGGDRPQLPTVARASCVDR
ncbi:MAG: uroporphyrinogen decarboxylase family protein [Kiritimatiellae bacterium]|nr:uroporphyrinogen decarboxylase family protein [Kiritimatiellia bacterium]